MSSGHLRIWSRALTEGLHHFPALLRDREQVTLVDRLLHRSKLIVIEGSSYRLKEATERATAKAKTRSAKRKA
jgi:hypothetical protein